MQTTASVRLTLSVLTIVFLLMACGPSDKERIRDMNESALVEQSFDPDALGGTISVFDIRDGDCFNAGLPSEYGATDTFEEVELVSCSGEWEYRVLDSFVVNRQGAYPGKDYFYDQAQLYCHRLWDFIFFPITESWELEDRTVQCLQESP